ncbi:MAG: hypothetical protein U1F19_06280 [Lysobacterales bacterium]
MIKNIATAFVIAAALNGCAGVEQKRNTENEARIAAYISKIGSAAPFNSAELCVNSTQLGAWAKYQINESTPVVATPSGARGAALCVKIPEDAKELRLDSRSTGGMSYFGMTIAHPSASSRRTIRSRKRITPYQKCTLVKAVERLRPHRRF